jgi:hypothetical protein
MKIPHELGLKRPATEFDEVLKLIDGISLANAAAASRRDKDGEIALEKANAILSSLAQQLAAVATIGWKMSKRITDPQSGEIRESFDETDGRKLSRDVQSLLTTLSEMGVTIRDRAGQAFDYGMPEKVVDAKPMKGITKERVAETLRPTVIWTTEFWKETMIQKGEVIIHTPES